MKQLFILFTLVMAIIISLSTQVLAEKGFTNEYILFGQTAAFTGPSASLGIGMRDGINIAFKEVNRAGGIHGRFLKLITLDDEYDPDITIVNVNKLVDEERVFSIIGTVGSATSTAAARIACDKKVPLIGPFTGVGFLRGMDCVVSVRGTYCQEAETWIDHLVEDLGVKRIAIIYQDEAAGREGKACVEKALSKRGLELVGVANYKRNTLAVKTAVAKIRKSNPDAIVTFATHKTAALFIKTARKIDLNVPVMNLSFTGGNAFSKELGKYIDNVIVSRVMPSPLDRSIPIVKEYQEALKSHNSSLEPDYVSMEGYIVGRLAIRALNEVGRGLSRESFLMAFNKIHDLGGLKMSYDMPKDNQGMDDIFLTVLKSDGSFEQVETLESLK